MRYRKTKIVATLGPASGSARVIERLLSAGVNVVRLNLSHGGRSSHAAAISQVRECARRLELPVAILLDLQGPRIRIGAIEGGSLELSPGRAVVLSPEGGVHESSDVTTTYADLAKDVRPGDKLLIDDGLIELAVTGVSGADVECEVVFGGTLREHKGINLPGVAVSAPGLSDKDVDDLEFGIREGVDYIALSFVRTASNVFSLKEMIRERGAEIPVIAKIENHEAVDNLEKIIEEADGVMIARGDLGVELSAELIPVLQKRIISAANEAGKVVITATQMLESMIKNPRPTRAEASDVANAVFDGTDALMLSGETAVGKYPVEAVEIMGRIAVEAEEAVEAEKRKNPKRRSAGPQGSFAQAVSYAAVAASYEVKSRAIVVFTQSGATAQLISRMRPSTPIIAFTPTEKTFRELALVWGVRPHINEFGLHTDEMICRGEAALLDLGVAEIGDTIVVVSGTKVGMRGATNMMKIDWIGSDECRVFLKDGRLGLKGRDD